MEIQMRNFVIALLILSVTACASSSGFDRGNLSSQMSVQKIVTEDDIQRAIELKPQLPAPFKLAIYLARPKANWRYESSWIWAGEDKAKLLEMGTELKNKNIISEVFIIGDSILEGTDNKAIRLAAARAGADAVLIVNGVGAIDRYNNVLGSTYILLVTQFFIPGTEIDSLVMLSASMWDVRNQYLYLSSEAEGSANESRPAFFAEESRVTKSAKANALAALKVELLNRLSSMSTK